MQRKYQKKVITILGYKNEVKKYKELLTSDLYHLVKVVYT